jgi:hypothetical protein
MRRFLLTLALLLPASLGAQKADFRGVWVLDAAKSDLGQLGQMLGAQGLTMTMTRTVTQTDTSLTFKADVEVMGQQQSQEQTIVIDGMPRTQTMEAMGNMQVTMTARWENGTLIVEQKAQTPMGEVGGTETWSLSADGKTLTVAGVTQTPNGEMKMTYVHTKKDS